jgi:hypothetical protein
MPFLRTIRQTPIAAPEGVHFSLNSAAGRSRLVHCIATRAGLEFLAGRHLTIEQLDRTFHVYRDRIEDAARRKSDASVRNRVLTLTAADFSLKAPAAQPASQSQWIAGRALTLPLAAP